MIERCNFMGKTPKELLKAYVDRQEFHSTTQIMDAMKEMFRDVLQRRRQAAELPQRLLEEDDKNAAGRGRGEGSPGPERGVQAADHRQI